MVARPHKHIQKKFRKITLLLAAIAVGGLVIGSSVGITWGVVQRPTAAQTATQLSPRTQEFIQSQRAKGNSWLNITNLDERTFTKSANNLQVVTECFGFELSLTASHLRERDGQPCVVEAKLQPSGLRVVISATTAATLATTNQKSIAGESQFFDELSGVQLRRSLPDVYQEASITTQFGEGLIFYGPKDITVFTIGNAYLFTIGISDFAHQEMVTPEFLQNVLTGIEV